MRPDSQNVTQTYCNIGLDSEGVLILDSEDASWTSCAETHKTCQTDMFVQQAWAYLFVGPFMPCKSKRHQPINQNLLILFMFLKIKHFGLRLSRFHTVRRGGGAHRCACLPFHLFLAHRGRILQYMYKLGECYTRWTGFIKTFWRILAYYIFLSFSI